MDYITQKVLLTISLQKDKQISRAKLTSSVLKDKNLDRKNIIQSLLDENLISESIIKKLIGAGPPLRIYSITPKGEEILSKLDINTSKSINL